jgi:hypothetical protein
MAPYVSNGELIAAALYLGLPVDINHRNVNALIGVNELQVRKLSHMESQKPDLIRGSPPWHGRHERHACPL